MIKNWFDSIFTKKSLTLISSPPSMFQLEIAPSLATKPENLGKSGTPSPNAMARISSSSHTSPRKARTLSAKSAVVLEHGTRRANTLLSMSLSTTLAKSQPSKSNSLTIIPNLTKTAPGSCLSTVCHPFPNKLSCVN
ncbi:hypothetical protein NC652_017660 [Populus alba x Populus x berolinensis]|nr:hypothetical protein NC652_017654 [Populus alba x Populus x berolinensis]KAJ6924452.1 hypothetical protein NC652_017660 [Populus alba x Populus x berolinensis]